MGSETGQRRLAGSSDIHPGPHARDDLLSYCPPAYLEQYDELLDLADEDEQVASAASSGGGDPLELAAVERTKTCAGQAHPQARSADTDAEGIAAEAIFARSATPLAERGAGQDASALNLEDLRRVAPGTAYVESVELHGPVCRLKLNYPQRRDVEASLYIAKNVVTDPDSIAGRPIAVRIVNALSGPNCSVLTSSESGPRTYVISVGQAIALSSRGVHSVVVSDAG